jgi:hypothetical protein
MEVMLLSLLGFAAAGVWIKNRVLSLCLIGFLTIALTVSVWLRGSA